MNRRLLLINSALAVVLVWGGLKIREGWRDFDQRHDPAQVNPDTEGIRLQPVAARPVESPVDVQWTEASARNPFSFDRNDVNLVVETPAASQTPASPVPILYGTLSLGGPPVAILGDGTRRSSGTKVGESFGGWKVVEINESNVVVAMNDRKETLIKGATPRDREPVRTAATAERTVISPSVAPASSAPASANLPSNPYNMNLNPSIPSEIPKGTVLEYTPFGYRLVQAK